MFVTRYQAELEFCLSQAAGLLGGSARPVYLEWELDQLVRGHLMFESRCGLGREPPLLTLDRSKRGHELAAGIECYRWETEEGTVRVAKVVLPCMEGPLDDFWAVRAADYRRFYRFLRRAIRREGTQRPPVMSKVDRKRLWDNTIGLLRSGQAELARYGIVPKRGVLLLGEPGNGKTMACRWLSDECRRRGLEWRSVTAEMYENARCDRNVRALFRLDSPGIVLFDDFDAALRDLEEPGESGKQSTFLAELDGVELKAGIVYLFTSNAALSELDPAMTRPGRIDVVVHFRKPDATLRRALIGQRWHADLLAGIDPETVVEETGGFSFAEMEEVKKLLVMRHLETGRWQWPWVRQMMGNRRRDHRRSRPIGFGAGRNGHAPRTARPVAR